MINITNNLKNGGVRVSFLISVKELENKLMNEEKDLIVIDVRYQLNDLEAGRKAYEMNHIPGAIYLDLKEDLSRKVSTHGGGHPLPDWKEFAGKLGQLGINQQTEVVIYGVTNDMYAARCLWIFEHLNHDQARILDGGWESWVAKDLQVTTEIPSYERKIYSLGQLKNDTVNINDVKEKLENKSATLIDSRGHERYLGRVEPMYKKAGHIPGAKNFFWKDVLDDEGNWKESAKLEKHFKSLDKDEEIIVSCGSGVSACPNVLALKQAGFTNVKLYPGSFSDWISYDDNPLETVEE